MHSVRDALEQIGIRGDDVLMVHSAFRLLGREGLTPQGVCATLCEFMAAGTLLMPAMSWRNVDPAEGVFSERDTPSNVGVIAETFRTAFAQGRSLHPTHSVAATGRLAERMLADHPLDDTPCSARSPFGRLVETNAWILLLGATIDSCTLVHHGEETVAPAIYLRPSAEAEIYRCTDRHGQTSIVRVRRHYRLRRNFWQFQDALERGGRLRLARVGNAVCRAFRARHLHEEVVTALTNRADAVLAQPGERYRLM